MPYSDPFLDSSIPLTPTNSVAAMIMIGGRYLLQFRDAKKEIWYPAHWGLFGGTIEKQENEEAALKREILEELDIHIDSKWISFFSTQGFDFRFAGFEQTQRAYYEVKLPEFSFDSLTLKEGNAMQLFEGNEILSHKYRIAPYDLFALWMHHHKKRFDNNTISFNSDVNG